jgi:CTP:molybdopterin cytidylyltransferase MocA/HD superfamily phosphohydrolase YqeK
VRLYRAAGVTDIRVVAGHGVQRIQSALAGRPVHIVDNPHPARGMFASIQAGARSLDRGTPSFFVHPVDIPLVRPHTVIRLMTRAEGRSVPVVYPVFGGRRGHPPLIDGGLQTVIADYQGPGGLRAVLDRYRSKAVSVPVADEGVLHDADTPEDAHLLASRLNRAHCLNDEECQTLLEQVGGLPAAIIDHCHLVADVAVTLADAVNTGGGDLDAHLINAAARVHDVRRLAPDHATAGARLLAEMGFPAMAAIVAVHMDIHVDRNGPLDEAQIVYLADKLVTGDRITGVAQRFEAKIKRYGQVPERAEAIQRRRRSATAIQAKLEAITKRPVSSILASAGLVDGEFTCTTT